MKTTKDETQKQAFVLRSDDLDKILALFPIALQADGKILVGGLFDNIIPQARSHFARLSNDTAALQNLTVTQATITWTRGGSSPQFTRYL